MDNTKINQIINDIKESLSKYNIKLDINASINSNGFKLNIAGIELDKLKEIDNLNRRISLSYGFTQNIIGMEFESDTGLHKIVSFKTANRKYPIITTQIYTGKSYKFPVDMVKNKLGGDSQINRKANLDKLLEN